MVNYGYAPDTIGWKEQYKWALAWKLNELLDKLSKEGKIKNVYAVVPVGMDGNAPVDDGQAPYIEVDGLYEGVRIRKTTHLTDEQESLLIKESDKIYREVMEV